MMTKVKEWADNNLKGDPIIWAIIFALSLISILVVYSATGSLAYAKMEGNTEHYLIKHGTLVVFSLVCMWVAHKIDYKYYSKLSLYALWLSVPLLLYTYFFGTHLNETSRSLTIPFINQTFQTSDLAKLALISNLASMLAKRQANIDDFKETFIPTVLWSGVICGLIALSNFSTAVMLFGTCLLLMFIGRVPSRYLFMLIMTGLFCLTMGLYLGDRLGTAIKRVKDFFTGNIPEQAQQSFIAIANGNVFGLGPGNSIARNSLPHSYSDFIYSIILEEYGMIGGLIVLFLYMALLYRGMRVMVNSDRAFGGLLSAGLTFSLVIQAMINMGVCVGLGPITGQPLPLLSMGGTSLIFTGLSLGIIISVSRGDLEENYVNEGKNVVKEPKAA